jgi:hypothetical protein
MYMYVITNIISGLLTFWSRLRNRPIYHLHAQSHNLLLKTEKLTVLWIHDYAIGQCYKNHFLTARATGNCDHKFSIIRRSEVSWNQFLNVEH